MTAVAAGSSSAASSTRWTTDQLWKLFREKRSQTSVKVAANRVERRCRLSEGDRERSAKRRVPLDLLAREWLNEQRATADTRAFLVDNLLPTLVLGLEKLLNEVSLCELAESAGQNADFNPVNYLAQYLMRNNPRYSNFPETSPYYHSMRQVSEDLKRAAFSVDEKHLAKLKVENQCRRVERERREVMRVQEEERRDHALEAAFAKWTLPGKESVGLSEVQQALRLWLEATVEDTAAEAITESLSPLLEAQDRPLNRSEFSRELHCCTKDLPGDVFDKIVEQLRTSGEERRRRSRGQGRRELFSGVFSSCDPEKTGYVDRLKMLNLLTSFYDSSTLEAQEHLSNPRYWPVAELVGSEAWEKEEETRGERPALSEQEYQEFLEGSTREGQEEGKKEGEGEGEAIENAGDENPMKEKDGSKEEGEEEKEGKSPQGVEVPPEKQKSTEAQSVSRARTLSGMAPSPVGVPSGPGGPWDHRRLNQTQFIQMVELFLRDDPESSVVDSLSAHLRGKYAETAQEREQRLEQAQKIAAVELRYKKVESLFAAWDRDCSGYLELEELQLVLSQWKGCSSEQAKEKVEFVLGQWPKYLTRSQFHGCIEQLTEGTNGTDELIDYLRSSIKLSPEELSRGERRQQLLSVITQAGKTSGLQFTEALKAAVVALEQDGAEFGGGKHSSVAIGVLEPSTSSSPPCLHFTVASTDCQEKVVGKRLHRTDKQVSFLSVDSQRPVHVPNIQTHGGISFFCPEHKSEEFNGSLVVSPIITPTGEVVGTLSVDTLSATKEGEGGVSTFLPHELSFHQGVGVCLGQLHHWLASRLDLLHVAQSALHWLHTKSSLVSRAEVYIVEPAVAGEEEEGCTLRRMLVTSMETSGGGVEGVKREEGMRRKDDLHRQYLFQCVDLSQPVSAIAFGCHHLVCPIRDQTGCPVAITDLSLCQAPSLLPHQTREVARAFRVLTVALRTLSLVPDHRQQGRGGEEEEGGRKEEDMAVLFNKLLLADLREEISQTDNRLFADLRSFTEPPPAILRIIQVLLYTLHPEGEFETWSQCKNHITLALVKKMEAYDPLLQTAHPKLSLTQQLLGGIPAGSLPSHPSALIHSWVEACLSLLNQSIAVSAPPVKQQ